MIYQDAKSKRQRYEALHSALKSERSSFDSHWRDLADWTLPRRTRFWAGDRNRGDMRNQKIINSTARFSARTLASGLHAGLTSPARPWMKLTTPDPQLAEFGPVKEWLHVVSQRMLTVFAQTNLYNMLPIVYGDMGLFATAAMSVVQDSKDLFRCYTYPLGSFVFGQNERGVVSTFAREYQLSVRQIVESFGLKANGRDIDWTHISGAVQAAWDKGDYETPVDLTWMVAPNEDYRRDNPLARYKKFTSCHFECGSANRPGDDSGGGFLRESGYDTFPVLGPRWDVTGEDTYGTDCPGMTALGDIKQLQGMERKKAQAIAKAVDPPLSGPSSLRTQKTSLLAGDITYVDTREGMNGLKPIHETRLEGLQYLIQDSERVEYRIQRAFYEDLFLMLARSDAARGSQPITAREVEERHEEKLIALGPVLERTNDELLDPLVDRVYALMDEAGLIPEPPEQLAGVDLKVEYISILAQAQKLVGVVGLDRFLTSAGQMASVFGESVLDKVDTDQAIDNYGEMLGVDPRLVRSTEDAQALRAQRAQQQQQAAQAAQAKDLSVAIKNAGSTKMEGDTALNRIVQGATGGAAMAPAGAAA
jgi:hypothetical protein